VKLLLLILALGMPSCPEPATYFGTLEPHMWKLDYLNYRNCLEKVDQNTFQPRCQNYV
jgi:hypothetical protein